MLDGREQLRERADGPMLVLTALGDHESGWQPGAGPPPPDYWHEHVLPKVVDKDTARYTYPKLIAHFGHLAIEDIEPSDVAAYVAARKAGAIGRPSVGHTIARELSVLNAAIVHATKAKRLPKDKAPFIQLPPASPPRDRWLREEEADRLLAAALVHVDPHSPKDKLPRVYRFVALALMAASRKSAILSLKRRQVDLQARMIDFNPAGRVQTNKRRARVPISDELLPILTRTLAEIPDDPEAFVLDTDGAIKTAFTNCVERAGLGRDVTPHVLRHTWGTWAAQSGASMFDIAGVMGDSVATVTKTYAHHNPDYLRSTVNNVRRSARKG